MNLSTPFLLLKTLLFDLLQNPNFIYDTLKRYINERSMSYPIGKLPTCLIFDLIPDANQRIISLQNIFEIPKFSINHPIEEKHFTASTNLVDSYCLALFSQLYAREAIIEVGTSFGESTLTLALNSPKECIVHTFDVQTNNPSVGCKFKNTSLSYKIKQHFTTLKESEKLFESNTIDLIFIDGDHSYHGVMADTQIALKLIRSKGVIIWHDYSFSFRNGVVKALDELNKKYDLGIRKIAHTNLACMIKK